MSEYPVPPNPAPDGLLVTPVWTTLTTPFDAMTEQRKAKQVFAKYDVSLKYPEGMTNADIMTLWAFYMARRGAYQAFYIYDLLSQAHTGLFVGWGDGETTIFDIPGKSTSGQAIYRDGVAVDMSAAGASGSVTLANMRLSLVNGTAFVDFSAAGVLTPFLNHKLTITDSAGKTAIGYIKAAGTGETYGATLNVSNCVNSGTAPYDTFDTASPTGYHVIKSTAGIKAAGTADELSFVAGTVLQTLFTLTLTSGAVANVVSKSAIGGVECGKAAWASAAGANTSYETLSVTTTGVVQFYNASNTEHTISGLSVRNLLTPSATGVTITSTPGGTTYNWASIESGFNYNDASGYTYQISAGVVLDGGGAEDSDRISFSVPPAVGVLITCDLTGYLRMRVRFKEDKFSRQSLTHLISAGGTIELKGLSPEDL